MACAVSAAVAAAPAHAEPTVGEAGATERAPAHVAQMQAGFLARLPAAPSARPLCVVDTGVNRNPDTAPALVSREALDGGAADDGYVAASGIAGHGTLLVQALAGPANRFGSVGVWPALKVVSVRVLGDGSRTVAPRDIAAGIDRCRVLGAGVALVALASPEVSSPTQAALTEAVARAAGADMLVVAGTGNDGGPVQYPAATDGVLAVGGSAAAGGLCAVSSAGPELDLLAPGCGLQIGLADGSLGSGSGTSFASAFVAGVASALRAHAPRLSAAEVADVLTATARPTVAGRELDAAAAFSAAGIRVTRPNRAPTRSSQPPRTRSRHAELSVRWRAPKLTVRADARRLVVRIGSERFVSTSGGLTLTRFACPRRLRVRLAASSRWRSVRIAACRASKSPARRHNISRRGS